MQHNIVSKKFNNTRISRRLMGFLFFGKKRDDAELEEMHKRVSESFSRVKKDIDKIGGWISHLDHHKKTHDSRIEELERRIIAVEHHLRGSATIERSSIQSFNRDQSRSNQSFMNVQSLSDKITPKEKRVILCLLEAQMPLEYSEIAKKLEVSVITTRRHINDIKKSGFKIEEKMNTLTKRKVFYIDQRTKKALLAKSESSKELEIEEK